MARFFERDGENGGDIKRLKFIMLIYYAVIIIGIISFISINLTQKTDDVLKEKISELTNHLNVQMQMNMDSYLSRVENTATLIFADKEFYTYDATDASNDEYEALTTEDAISDRLYDLCMMENFVDFSIVYGNNHVVGKLSNNTKDLFGDRLYEDLSAIINRERTHDGWLAGYNGNYNRIYYAKRINDNAVLLTSFYVAELDSVFEHPGGIEDFTIRLIEENDVVIYSSEDGEMGTVLDSEISEKIHGYDAAARMDGDYLITVSDCGDNWRVVCSAPTRIILKETSAVQWYVLTIGVIVAVIALALSMVFSFGVSSTVDRKFNTLSKKARTDQLTGLLNKRAFEVKTDSLLKYAQHWTFYALILIDIDDFKKVNDTYGHAYGDKILAGTGEILRKTFRTDDCLGRIGGDEFCVCMYIKGHIEERDRTELIRRKCSELVAAFKAYSDNDERGCTVSASIGVSVCPTNGKTFSELYKSADVALYQSKQKGKNMFTMNEEVV